MNNARLTFCAIFVVAILAISFHHFRSPKTITAGHRSLSPLMAKHRPHSSSWLNVRVKMKSQPLLPVMQEFSDMIRDDPVLYMLCNEMLAEVPSKYATDVSGRPEVRDIETLIHLLNYQITQPPEWDMSPQIGTPLNAILDWPMGTKAGFAVFLSDKMNRMLKKIINQWAKFLSSPESLGTVVTTNNGWLSPTAQKHSIGLHDFAKKYICQPELPHWGFTSWDNFFTREFRPGVRPLASPEDESVIISPCEAKTFAIQKNVKLRDTFWIKGEPYSLIHMMNNDSRAESFIGGTVFQAYLSGDSYHRWHTPTSGTIESVEIVPGTYFSEMPLEGFGMEGPEPEEDVMSQGYISSVAARGVIFVQADNPSIGLYAIVMIGIGEVSSVDVTMPIGQHFKKGEQLGMFHFGGSSYCLVFRPNVKLTFQENALPSTKFTAPVPVRSTLAYVRK